MRDAFEQQRFGLEFIDAVAVGNVLVVLPV
jgi:hypothetical protein